MSPKQQRIVSKWEEIEGEDPGISTEMLMHRVETVCKCSSDEVCDALEADSDQCERKPVKVDP